MLCRKGNITRQDIGAIRIFEHETKVEVAEAVATNFLRDMRRPGGDNIRVERLNGDADQASFEPPAKKAGKPKKRPPADRRPRS